MMNPSIDHRSVSRKAALAAFALAIGMTTPVAAMRIGGVESSPPLMMPVLVPAAKAAAAPGAGPARKPARTPRSATKPMQTPAGGSVGGTVFDASGAVIPGVTVVLSVIEQTQSGLSEHPVLTAVTGPAGEFLFRSLAARQYSLKAELPGFLSLRSGSFELKPGQALNENLTLALGSVVQKVEVQAVGPQTPLPPGTPRRVRVGGNVRAPALIAPVKPLYPRAARDAGIEGMVRLQGIIATDGSILALSVLNADAGEDLKDAAMDAVQQWRYRPTLLNGVPVEVLTTIEVDFKLVH